MLAEYLRIAARALTAHRFRSGLTVFSIFLGAFSIVLMSSLANSGLTSLAKDIEALGGARIVLFAPKKPERAPGAADLPAGKFSQRDVQLVFDAVPHVAAKTVYASQDDVDARNQAMKVARVDLVASDAGFFDALDFQIGEGRRFTAEEDHRRANVCVVGDAVAKALFEGHAVGQWMTVDGMRCRIVGQHAKTEHWDVNMGFDWNRHVVMPVSTVTWARPALRAGLVMQIVTEDVAYNDIVKRVGNAILVDRHHGVDDYQIWDFNAFMAQFEVIFAALEAVVGLIASIALLVGGIGVMNMMLVSVSERTREIGIRKALGASPRAISTQFLAEAGLLSGSGGLLGTGLGVLAALGANALIKSLQPIWVSTVSLPAALIALSVSVLVGILFGFLPARRAARLDPVEAVRR